MASDKENDEDGTEKEENATDVDMGGLSPDIAAMVEQALYDAMLGQEPKDQPKEQSEANAWARAKKQVADIDSNDRAKRQRQRLLLFDCYSLCA